MSTKQTCALWLLLILGCLIFWAVLIVAGIRYLGDRLWW